MTNCSNGKGKRLSTRTASQLASLSDQAIQPLQSPSLELTSLEKPSLELTSLETPSLEPLVQLVREDMEQVNKIILARMQSEVALIPQLAGHLIAAGGKRLRPLITLSSARLCDYQGSRQFPLAAAVEFIHTATLLHDDVVDESVLRRGLPSANELYGNKASVLVGDFLFSRAFSLMVEDGSLRVFDILSNASAVIAEGEVLQLVTSNDLTTNESDYLRVIESKTAVLFEAAAEIGAIVADPPFERILALKKFGRNLGMVFQLIDDALDYTAKQQQLGKTVGDDFREGKITLPVITAYAAGDPEQKQFWQRTIEYQQQEPTDFAEALRLIQLHRGVAITVKRAKDYAELAIAALAPFDDCTAKRALIETVHFTVSRQF